jgi:hypothetical protein
LIVLGLRGITTGIDHQHGAPRGIVPGASRLVGLRVGVGGNPTLQRRKARYVVEGAGNGVVRDLYDVARSVIGVLSDIAEGIDREHRAIAGVVDSHLLAIGARVIAGGCQSRLHGLNGRIGSYGDRLRVGGLANDITVTVILVLCDSARCVDRVHQATVGVVHRLLRAITRARDEQGGQLSDRHGARRRQRGEIYGIRVASGLDEISVLVVARPGHATQSIDREAQLVVGVINVPGDIAVGIGLGNDVAITVVRVACGEIQVP